MAQEPNRRPRALDVMTGSWRGQALYVAAKLGVADLLAGGPRSVTDLAVATSVDPEGLYRVLRALAGIGFFHITDDKIVELTPDAEFLRSSHPDSVRQFALMVNEEVYEAFGSLLLSVRTGRPSFTDRYGMHIFQYYDQHPEVAATFHRAMNDWSNWDTPAIVDGYDFSRFQRVVDVGGGNGAFLSALLARHSNLSGLLYERPAAVEAARAGEGGPLPRCELVVGDMHEAVPPGADLYTIKHVIDGFSDDEAVRILSNIRRAMSDRGRVLVLDCVVQPGNEPSFIKWLDLLVLTTTDGKMRQVSDYAPIFAKAGLSVDNAIRISDSVTIIEGSPC